MDSFPPATGPLIALTTDFGLSDPFTGTMKGVIAAICPAARVVDLTHGVEAFCIEEGAIKLWQAARYFPDETIHVAVVDPGVGSDRRGILARIGLQWFVAPDNGVLSWILADAADPTEAWQLENAAYFLAAVSRTFHGRDIFAPVAAHLACGIAPAEFGRSLDPASLVRLPDIDAVQQQDGSLAGRVLLTDRFGNLLTNIREAELPRQFEILIAGRIFCEIQTNYAAGSPTEPFAIVGSAGLVEIAVSRGSAAEILNARAGDPVSVRSSSG